MSDFIDPGYDPHLGCDGGFQRLTELKNGRWSYLGNDTEVQCRVRCHDKSSSTNNRIGNWTYEPGPVDCEVLEAVCGKNGTDIYGHLHTQIIKQSPSPPESRDHLDNSKPNVFVILLDSLSYGDAKRSFNKTIPYIVKNFEAVEFPFINKIGENSRPNAVALWFGKLLFDIDNTLFGGKLWKADLPNNIFCGIHLDNQTNIYKEFKEKGYKTMNAEDWKSSVLVYPSCKGFKEDPYDHNMHPFQIAYGRGNGVVNRHLDGRNCRETFHPVVEYLEQFIEAYPDDPKFSWIWLSNVGHDHESSFFRVDGYFEEFMKRNREVIDSSFLILMGDHGQRIGPSEMFETKTAQLEINNPYLSISIPKKYRKSGILEKMRENAKKLQSHFDTRATILDIVRYQPSTNFTSTNLLNIPDEKGHSYFRSQPDFDRNCGSLPIPPEFCICQSGSVPVKDDGLVKLLGSKITDRVNEIVKEKHFESYCIKMELENILSIEKYDQIGESDVYLVYIRMAQPSNATFRALIQHQTNNDEFKIQSVIRSNIYGKTADCIDDEFVRPFCHCRKAPGF